MKPKRNDDLEWKEREEEKKHDVLACAAAGILLGILSFLGLFF